MKMAGTTSEKCTFRRPPGSSSAPGMPSTASSEAFQVRPLAATDTRFAASAANTSVGLASVITPPSAFRSSLVERSSTPQTTAVTTSIARSAMRRCGRSSPASSEMVTNWMPCSLPASRIRGSASTVCDRSSPLPEPSASCRSRIAPG